MDSGAKSALLIGASGLVGGHCLELLLNSHDYGRIVVCARRPLAQKHRKLEQHVFDFGNIPDDATLFSVHDVYCCLGTTIAEAGSKEEFALVDRDYPRAFAERAANQGARQFLLVSSVGADASSGNFYLRVKGEVEADIVRLGFPATHIFRPSMLLGKRAEFRWKEKLFEPLMRATSWMLAGSLRRYRPIDARAVAAAMLAAAAVEEMGVHMYEGARLEALALAQETATT